jgi:aryl-alcohol dehydrogenase-like predicted oxidoreductase
MQKRRFGRSGLKVSEVGLGCGSFGAGRMDQAVCRRVVDVALDAGIDLFDTADAYGGSQSEVMLGAALGKRRSKVVVATKFGAKLPADETSGGGSRRWIMRAVEDSLTRLGFDYIDLYQIHHPDPTTPIEETLRALDDLITQGKVRYIGCSNFAAWRIAEAAWTARTAGFEPFVSAQNEFSLLNQKAAADVLPACEHYGMGFLPWFALGSGLLTGKYRRSAPPPEGARLQVGGHPALPTLSEANLMRVERLDEWATARGHTILELAFAWLFAQPGVTSVLAGATSPEQAAANAAGSTWRLAPDEAAEVAALVV